jgi:crotonobetainyl-CoA:carnitine CoA-transferase CaiB-like acyl-CoA transferase
VTVLDMGRALAAPFCSLLLADLGADVIKVEHPDKGDDSRMWPPHVNGESTYFLSVNRNKRSISVDLHRTEGQDLIRDMVKTADVVLHNFRPGVAERWGLGYEHLADINPLLVYCSITGFGLTGPSAGKPATDIFMQAYGGLMSVTGVPGEPPLRTGVSIADLTAGMLGAYGILGALYARTMTGRGQLVGTSLLEGQLALLSYHLTGFGATGVNPGPLGLEHPSISPYRPYEAADGWVSLAAFNDRLFERAVSAMGLHELVDHPWFKTNADRVQHRAELNKVLAEQFATKSVAEWTAIMDSADVPLAPVNTVADLARDPQVAACDMVQQIDHPTAGALTTFGFPVKFSDNPSTVRYPPPTLGEHTNQVLLEYGYTRDQIDQLRTGGVIK